MITTAGSYDRLSRAQIARAAVAAGVAAALATLCAPWAVSALSSWISGRGAAPQLPFAVLVGLAAGAGAYASWSAVRALRTARPKERVR